MNSDIIDFDNLLIQFCGDKEIINRFLNICINELPERIEKLKDALKVDDNKFLKINAHTIKGIAANMRAESLKQASENLENVCKKNKHDGLKMHIDKIEYEFVRLESYIAKHNLL